MAHAYNHDDDAEEELDDDEEGEEEDDDELDEEEETDDEGEGEDQEEVLARIEKAFRSDRVRIRASNEIAELRRLRSEYQTLESNTEINQAARIRARDLVELIDDRITDLKAKRLADRRG
jgi:hypothetical protein